MPKTPSVRHSFRVPYTIPPSSSSEAQVQVSDPARIRQRQQERTRLADGRLPDPQASSSASSNSQIWKSIESIILSQRSALEAQSQKLAEISSSIEKRLDRIHTSQCDNASSIKKELAELKALVEKKRDEGFRFQGLEWEKMMEVGWIADRGTEFGLVRATVSPSLGGVMISGVTQERDGEGEMRFEDLIDMDRFEDLHEPRQDQGQQDHPGHDSAHSQRALDSILFSASSESSSDISLANDILPYDTEGTNSHIASKSTNAEAGPSISRNTSRPRASSELTLSSGIESLPETETDTRSQAGSDITDILTGINTYLARPGRARPLSTHSPAPVPAPPPEHRLRTRTSRPIYSSKWHPMDSTRKQLRLEDEAQKAADLANEEERSVRGLSTAPRTFLGRSDGERKEGGRDWWKWGENSLIGRMQDISCDLCRGRAHWACAGLSQHDDMTQESWFCPDCYPTLDNDPNATPQHIPEVQQDRCIRPDCILRSKRALNKKKGDDSRHVVERIIGRRVLSRRVNGSKRYEYLCKWEGWEYYESTWQDPSSFDDGVKHPQNQFLAQCTKEGINSQARVVLLKEAEEFWDENGDLRVELLEELGKAEAEWWPSPKGKYKVLIA